MLWYFPGKPVKVQDSEVWERGGVLLGMGVARYLARGNIVRGVYGWAKCLKAQGTEEPGCSRLLCVSVVDSHRLLYGRQSPRVAQGEKLLRSLVSE